MRQKNRQKQGASMRTSLDEPSLLHIMYAPYVTYAILVPTCTELRDRHKNITKCNTIVLIGDITS